ncbi:MAG TPA: VOC family protein [Allosphingosinicella sp.]|jgi:hypothetical protein
MEPRLSIVTLGVADLPRAIAFYRDGLGLPPANDADGEGIAFFQLDGVRLALFPREELAKDAGLADPGPQPFSGITLAHNLRSKAEVDALFAHVASIGAGIVKRPEDVFWGGYSGYFSDPDGHLWEAAWNPHFEIAEPAR